jgi:hypothetical protein
LRDWGSEGLRVRETDVALDDVTGSPEALPEAFVRGLPILVLQWIC